MPDALELLKTRRSVKPMELEGPAPTPSEIETLLKIASRVPDHGKLAPWRFIVFEGNARAVAGDTIAAVISRRPSRGHARPDRIRAQASLTCAACHRGRQPRRSAREDSRMGAAALCRRLRDEFSSLPRMPWAMPPAGLRSGMLTTGAFSMRLASRRMSALRASFISAARQNHPRTVTGQNSMPSSRASAPEELIEPMRHLTFT